jgi:hypothetical protein
MKKILISVIAAISIFGAVTPAGAHGWHGGWRGGGYGWAPFAVGAVAGAVVASTYYRPAPIYYATPYYQVAHRTAAFCPENGLYYPQTQACPSGWQQVPVQ